MFLKNFIFNNSESNTPFKNYLFIFSLISFFFLWDVKINLYQNLIISLREIFYLLFIYLLFNYKKTYNPLFLKTFLFFSALLAHSYFSQSPLPFNLLDFKYNLLPILFIFFIFIICYIYIQEIIKNLNLAFIIFSYILIFSFFFTDVHFLSSGDLARYCSIISFKLVYNKIFLEASHVGMVLVPVYYYLFKVNNLHYFHKILFSIFLIFIVLFYSSITLFISVIICFILAILVDYRFFLKNKFFLFLQILILLLPIFKNNCMFKINDTLINLDEVVIAKSKNDKEYFRFIETNDKVSIKSSFQNEIDLINIDEFYILINEKLKAAAIPLKKNKKIPISKINEIIDLIEIAIENLKNISFQKDRDWLKVMIMNKGPKRTELMQNINFDRRKLGQMIGELKRVRGNFIKKSILDKQSKLSAKEMNAIIRENVDFFPIQKQRMVNDHSSAVLLNALTVAYHSIKEKPFGWGFNNYQTAFNASVLDKIIPPYIEIYYLNFNDASNNSIKLIVEFGVFSLIIFANLLYFVFNKKIPSSQRLLFGGIIATQMIRAAGYFNGGFMLCLVITFILNYKSLNKNEQ